MYIREKVFVLGGGGGAGRGTILIEMRYTYPCVCQGSHSCWVPPHKLGAASATTVEFKLDGCSFHFAHQKKTCMKILLKSNLAMSYVMNVRNPKKV